MKIDEIVPLLACPICKSDLHVSSGFLACNTCDVFFKIEEGVPNLIKENALRKDELECEKNTEGRYWDDPKKAEKYLVTESPMRNYMDESEVEESIYWLDLTADDFVLDVGCGSGRQSIPISETNKVIGVDRSLTMIKRAAAKANSENAFFVMGDALNLPFKDEAFTKALSVRMIQHLNDQEKESFFEEIHRILKQNASFVVMNYKTFTPHYWFIKISCSFLAKILNVLLLIFTIPLSWIVRLWGVKINPFLPIFKWANPEIAQFSSPREIERQIKKSGFQAVNNYKFQVGDVFLNTILSRAWSKDSEGTIPETFSISNQFFPTLQRKYYQAMRGIDKKRRTGASFASVFLFKDKIISIAKK